jgi:two-component system, NarL family, invasion response regulator UvrY
MRILLIEDHPIVRTACRVILQSRRGVEVAEASTAASGLELAARFSPHLVILDLRLPDGNGFDLIATLIAAKTGRKIVVFSMYEDPVFATRALEAGACGYITKNDDPDLILQAIDKVSSGGIFLTPIMAERLALATAGLDTNPLLSLSARERRVLGLLGSGKTLAEVATELNISYRTVAHATAQIKDKLHVPSTAALIRWAVDHFTTAAGHQMTSSIENPTISKRRQ